MRGAKIRKLQPGCCIVMPADDSGSGVFVAGGVTTPESVAVTCWKGHATCALLVGSAEASQLFDQLGGAPQGLNAEWRPNQSKRPAAQQQRRRPNKKTKRR